MKSSSLFLHSREVYLGLEDALPPQAGGSRLSPELGSQPRVRYPTALYPKAWDAQRAALQHPALSHPAQSNAVS